MSLKTLRLPLFLSHTGICHTGADMSHTNISSKLFIIMIGEEKEFLVLPECWSPVAVSLPLRLSLSSKVKVV